MLKMNEKEVNMLYKLVPQLDDPYFQGKKLICTVGENAYFHFNINGIMYLCKSNPNLDDEWYFLN